MVRVKVNQLAIEVAMSKKNISQREFAKKIGFSRGHVSHIITGKREPSAAMRRLILQQFPKYSFDDFFIIEEAKGAGDHEQS